MTFVTCTGAEAFQWVAEARARLERTPADTGDRQSPPRRQALQLLFRKDPDQAGQCPGNRPASAKGLEAQGGLVWPGLGAGPWSPRGLREETAGVRGGRTAAGALPASRIQLGPGRLRSPAGTGHPRRYSAAASQLPGPVRARGRLPAALRTPHRLRGAAASPAGAFQTVRGAQPGPGAARSIGGWWPARGRELGEPTPAQSFPRN